MSNRRVLAILAILLLILLFFIFLRSLEGNLVSLAVPTSWPTKTPTPTSIMADMPKDETSFPTPTSSASKSPTPTNIITNSPMVTVTTVLTAEEQAYDQFMIEHHTQFNQYMSNLGALFQVEEDEFVYSDDWHLSVERNLELMISEAEVIASYENVPEKFTDVHHWLSKLEPESRKFSEFVLRAIEDENINILELNQFFTSLYDILAYVVNANMEREKIISSVPDS